MPLKWDSRLRIASTAMTLIKMFHWRFCRWSIHRMNHRFSGVGACILEIVVINVTEGM